jgi:hypothetical protein
MVEKETNLPTKPRKPLWRRLLKWAVRLVIALVVLGIAAWSIGNYWAAKTLRQEVASIRAAGQPLTFADLDAMTPKAEEAQDAGPYYTAAMALTRDVDNFPSEAAYDQFNDAMNQAAPPPDVLAEAQRRLDWNQLALGMLDRGSKLSGCNYDMGLQYGIAVCMPHLNDARGLANAASLRTRLLAAQGHGDQAVQSLIASLRMSRIFDRQPVMIVNLVKIGCLAMACRDANIILNHGHASTAALKDLETALAQAEQSVDMRRMVLAERVFYLEITRDAITGERELKSADANAPPFPERQQFGGSSLPMRIMVAQTLPFYSRFLAATSPGWPGMVDRTQAIVTTSSSWWDMWGRIIAPTFARTAITTGHVLANLRAARIAARIERYRLTNGRLPASLDQLPNAVDLPQDPFTGKAFMYHPDADGYRVYSLGEDRHDQGGQNLSDSRGPNWGIQVRMPTTQPNR